MLPGLRVRVHSIDQMDRSAIDLDFESAYFAAKRKAIRLDSQLVGLPLIFDYNCFQAIGSDRMSAYAYDVSPLQREHALPLQNQGILSVSL